MDATTFELRVSIEDGRFVATIGALVAHAAQYAGSSSADAAGFATAVTEALAAALAGRIDVHRAASIDEAVERAAALARPGDVVLLSPACASQDQFRDFEDRGEHFRRAVRALADAGGTR
jgi:UDP-N-acetylmuramoylalanine-D-glutamate ligase